MNIQFVPQYKYNTNPQSRFGSPSFQGARDINLKYIYNNRLRLLPQRIRQKVTNVVENNGNIYEPLRDIHLKTYAPLLECKTLGKAQNMFYEFREVLPAQNVIQHKSQNVKKIMETTPLEDLSLLLLKERWGKLKTLDEIAKDLGLKNRSALAWIMQKIRIPDFGTNYHKLLSTTDEKLNREIAQKTKNYNAAHRDAVIAHNLTLSMKFKELNRQISQTAWDRLPHIKEAFSEVASRTNGSERFAAFWSEHPEYAQEFAQMKRKVAAELRAQRKA